MHNIRLEDEQVTTILLALREYGHRHLFMQDDGTNERAEKTMMELEKQTGIKIDQYKRYKNI